MCADPDCVWYIQVYLDSLHTVDFSEIRQHQRMVETPYININNEITHQLVQEFTTIHNIITTIVMIYHHDIMVH